MANKKKNVDKLSGYCDKIYVSGGRITGHKKFIRKDDMWFNPITEEKFYTIDDMIRDYSQKGKRKVSISCEEGIVR